MMMYIYLLFQSFHNLLKLKHFITRIQPWNWEFIKKYGNRWNGIWNFMYIKEVLYSIPPTYLYLSLHQPTIQIFNTISCKSISSCLRTKIIVSVTISHQEYNIFSTKNFNIFIERKQLFAFLSHNHISNYEEISNKSGNTCQHFHWIRCLIF